MEKAKKQHLELEKFNFLKAYNREAERINGLMSKFPDNDRYKETDKNLTEMLDVFLFMEELQRAMQTRIQLLELQAHLLGQDYMKSIGESLDQFTILTKKKP